MPAKEAPCHTCSHSYEYHIRRKVRGQIRRSCTTELCTCRHFVGLGKGKKSTIVVDLIAVFDQS